ncbi:MAG: hypothetical protein JRH20_11460 [Deltaproteobacteria bacterium]|nr:hypothetical protein [Deltaproteobacteria bacterium]
MHVQRVNHQPLRPMATISLVVMLLFAGWAETASAEKPGPTYRRHRSRIVWQPQAFESFSTEKEFSKIIAKARRSKVLKRDAKGLWPFHFIAFLKSKPRATKLTLVWYRLNKKREQVDFTEFTVPADGLTLQAQLMLKPLMGFKSGDRLEARVTRLVGGREKVYASCRITLK